MAYSVHKSMAIPFLFLLLASWALYTAGLASVQASCTDGTTGRGPGGPRGEPGVAASSPTLNTDQLQSTFGYSAGVLVCSTLYRFYWFIVAFALVMTLVALVVAMAPGVGLAATRAFWTSVFAIVAVLFMVASEAHLAALSSPGFVEDVPRRRMRTAAAGAIISVVFSILSMMAIGSVWGDERAAMVPVAGTGQGMTMGARGGAKPQSGMMGAGPAAGMAPAGV
jgi:hypothetical protein